MAERRVVRVSTLFVEMFLRGDLQTVRDSTMPPDARVVGVAIPRNLDIKADPRPSFDAEYDAIEFVIESASFPPLRPGEDPTFAPIYYSDLSAPNRVVRFFRRLRAAWRAA